MEHVVSYRREIFNRRYPFFFVKFGFPNFVQEKLRDLLEVIFKFDIMTLEKLKEFIKLNDERKCNCTRESRFGWKNQHWTLDKLFRNPPLVVDGEVLCDEKHPMFLYVEYEGVNRCLMCSDYFTIIYKCVSCNLRRCAKCCMKVREKIN